MKKMNIVLQSFLSSLALFVYVLLVSAIIFNGEKIFGPTDSFITPLAMLLLFVFSAAVSGILFLGKAVMLYLENSKKEALKLLWFNFLFLFIFILVIFIYLAVV